VRSRRRRGGGGGGGREDESRGRKGAEGTSEEEGEEKDRRGWRRIEKDEEDEEGDHGSIVAFRIPCHPSVDFRPLPLRSFNYYSRLAPLAARLLLSCPPSPLSLSRPYPPLPCTISRLARGPQPSTAVAYLHRRRARVVTQAQTHRPDIRLSSLLASSAFLIPLLLTLVHLVSLSTSRVQHFRPLCLLLSFFPSLFLSASCRFPSLCIAASEGEARAAQSRSVA